MFLLYRISYVIETLEVTVWSPVGILGGVAMLGAAAPIALSYMIGVGAPPFSLNETMRTKRTPSCFANVSA